ncbi:MAG: condensation domain-containing protein, partial [Geitlerinemataceae cyanobacterium]
MLDFASQDSGNSTVETSGLSTDTTPKTPSQTSGTETSGQGEFFASLAKMLEEQQQMPPLQRVDRNNLLPLSFAQERFWLLHQLAPENPFYNASISFQIHGNLNVIALEASLKEIIRRHEVLRTQFVTFEGKLAQFVRSNWEFN